MAASDPAREALAALISIEMRPGKMGGQPLLTGHRYPVAQLLAELADGHTLQDVAEDCTLDLGLLQDALRELSGIVHALPALRAALNRADKLEGDLCWIGRGTEGFFERMAEAKATRAENAKLRADAAAAYARGSEDAAKWLEAQDIGSALLAYSYEVARRGGSHPGTMRAVLRRAASEIRALSAGQPQAGGV